MARPNKNNAEYFSHDNSMRNHRKIKALRQKFGMNGYGAYSMLLETLTGSENFELKLQTEIDWNMLAGDFDVEVETLKNVIAFMVELELIQNDNGQISCKNLYERMAPLLEKRMRSSEFARTAPRDNSGKFLRDHSNGISETETPQSKEKENKEKENNYILANANHNSIKNKHGNPSKETGMTNLYSKFKYPIANIPIKNQWQEEATNACDYLQPEEKQKSSVFRFYKENNNIARIAFSDCKELGKKNADYFFKLCNEAIKAQTIQKQ